MSLYPQVTVDKLTAADRELRRAVRQGDTPEGKTVSPLLYAAHHLQLIPTDEMVEVVIAAEAAAGFHVDAAATRIGLVALRDYLVKS